VVTACAAAPEQYPTTPSTPVNEVATAVNHARSGWRFTVQRVRGRRVVGRVSAQAESDVGDQFLPQQDVPGSADVGVRNPLAHQVVTSPSSWGDRRVEGFTR